MRTMGSRYMSTKNHELIKYSLIKINKLYSLKKCKLLSVTYSE